MTAAQIDRLIVREVAPHLHRVRSRVHEAIQRIGSCDLAVAVWTDDGRGLVATRSSMCVAARELGAPEDILGDLGAAAPPGHVYIVVVGSKSIALALLHMLPIAERGAA
jgi:hypothetical protein